MADLGAWLEQLGLGKYAELFAREEVSMAELALLGDDDLREIGIPIGPRRKILDALGRLKVQAPSGLASRMPGPPSSLAERRQLTILFCDMVASTEIADRMDPEAFGALIQSFVLTCTDVIVQHGGLVASYVGDAVKAYFGYPSTREDEAERALAAAFDLLVAVRGLKRDGVAAVKVRIGLASGLVVVGSFPRGPQGTAPVAFGHVAHLAARIQAEAEPGTILVDTSTHTLAKGAFRFALVGERDLKGFNEPVQLWRALAPTTTTMRYEQRGARGPLVGRSNEISAIARLWDATRSNRRGNIALIAGGPGIGKSRLAHEMSRRLQSSVTLGFQGSTAFTNTVLHPILSELKRREGFQEIESSAIRLSKLRRLVEPVDVDSTSGLPIIAKLLAIRLEEGLPDPDHQLGPEAQEKITFDVLRSWLASLAGDQPILIIFEDAQWFDAATLRFIHYLAANLDRLAALILITSRDQAVIAHQNEVEISRFELFALGPGEAEAMIRGLEDGAQLRPETISIICQRAEGVPLYVEEFTRSAVDLATVARIARDATEPAGRLDTRIPISLQASLLARLDSLGEAKPIAQVAATIGREFDVELLGYAAGVSDESLEYALGRMVESGLVTPFAEGGRSTFVFKHALLQEAARDTILVELRTRLHGKIAEALAEQFPQVRAAHPELIAQHYFEAGNFEQAAEYWFLAGRRSAATWAKVEAAAFYQRAVDALRRLPESEQRFRREAEFEISRGDALYAQFGYATTEGGNAYQNALELSDRLNEVDIARRSLDGLFGIHFNSCHFSASEATGDRLITTGELLDDVAALVIGQQFKGMSLFCQGKLIEASHYLKLALERIDRADEVGSDYPSMAMIYLALTQQLLDEEEEASDLIDRAEAVVRKQSDYRLCALLGNACILFACRGDSVRIGTLTEELVPLAQRNGFNLWLNMGRFFKAWALAHRHRSDEGIRTMQTVCDSLGNQEIEKSCYLGLLAQAYVQVGMLADARRMIEQAIRHVESTGERYFFAELLRLRGQLMWTVDGDEAAAFAALDSAEQVATEQRARFWLRRCRRTRDAFLVGADGPVGMDRSERTPMSRILIGEVEQ